MPSSAVIGKIGKVRLTYLKGRHGPTSIEWMSEGDFARLMELIEAYAELDRIAKQPDDGQSQTVRKQMARRLGVSSPSPVRHDASKKYIFQAYYLRGVFKRTAVERTEVTLEPKYIETVRFLNVATVLN